MPVHSPYELRHAQSLRDVAIACKTADDSKAVLRNLRRELRAAAAPMVPAVRASIAAIPVKTSDKPYRPKGLKAGQAWVGGERASLRSLLQRATRLYAKTAGKQTGIVIMVDGRKMPPGMKGLPKYEEGTKAPWRHPVFGRWLPNQPNQPPNPYFYKVVEKLGPAARLAVNRAMDRVSNDITGRSIRNVP